MFDKQNEFSIAKIQYEEGLTLEKSNPQKAITLFKKSAESGNLMAASHLSTIYETGLLVKIDIEAAKKYEILADKAYDELVMSVSKNNKEALVMLSYCYQNGIYVIQDPNLAISFCEDALKQDPFYTPAIIELMNAWKRTNWKKGIETFDSYLNQHKMFDINNQTLKIFLDPHFVTLLLEVANCYRKGKRVSKDVDKASQYLRFALTKNAMLAKPLLDIWKLKNLAEKAYSENDFYSSTLYYHYLLLLDDKKITLSESKIHTLLNSANDAINILSILINSSFYLAKFDSTVNYCGVIIKQLLRSLTLANVLGISYYGTQISICHALNGDLTTTISTVPNLFRIKEEQVVLDLESILKNTSSEHFPDMHNNLLALAQYFCKQKRFQSACCLLTHILKEKQGLLKNYKPGVQLPILMEVIDCYLECTKTFTPVDKSLGKFLLSIKNYSHATLTKIQSQKEKLQPIKNSAITVQLPLVECKAEVVEKEIVQSTTESQNPARRNIKLTAMARRFNRSETVKAFENNFQLLIELLNQKGSKTPNPKITKAILEGMERFLPDKERLRQMVQKSGLDIKLPVEQTPEMAPSVEKLQDKQEKAKGSLPLWKEKFLDKHAKDDQDIPATPKLRKRAHSMGSVRFNEEELKKFKPKIRPEPPFKESEKKESNELAIIAKPRKLTKARKTYYENKQNSVALLPPPKSRKRSNSMWIVPTTAKTGVLPTSNREKYATEASLYADKLKEFKRRKSPFPLYFIGDLYSIGGEGVKPNPEKAIKLFDKVIALYDLPSAYYSKGMCYKEGRGVPKNILTAFKYFHVAARKGFTLAQVELALLYFTGGTDIEFNMNKAFKWMQRAAWFNEPRAIKWLKEHSPQSIKAPQSLPDSAQEKNISETALVLYKPAPKPLPKMQWRIKDTPTPAKEPSNSVLLSESKPSLKTAVLPPICDEPKYPQNLKMKLEALDKINFCKQSFEDILIKLKPLEVRVYSQWVVDYFIVLFKAQTSSRKRQEVTNDITKSLKFILLPDQQSNDFIKQSMNEQMKKVMAERRASEEPKSNPQANTAVKSANQNPVSIKKEPVRSKQNPSVSSKQSFFGKPQQGVQKKADQAGTPTPRNLGRR